MKDLYPIMRDQMRAVAQARANETGVAYTTQCKDRSLWMIRQAGQPDEPDYAIIDHVKPQK